MKSNTKYWRALKDNFVQCYLCPHNCKIEKNKNGICLVRKNINGNLVNLTYGKLSAMHEDPIEKKPLYHFFPGKNILSIGSVGCNLKCAFCQNCSISQTGVEHYQPLIEYDNEEIINIVNSKQNNIGIAFTYNEPLINYEFVFDISKRNKENNLYNVVVSNGYIQTTPLEQLLEHIDAFNIDLKAFNENFFKRYTKSELAPVLETIKQIKKAGKHLEITNLIIPGLNDDEVEFRSMIEWIYSETGEETPLHLSKYFPRHKMNIESTEESKIHSFFKIAKEKMLFVYGGNINNKEMQDTNCPKCNETLISRNGYKTNISGIGSNGKCKSCGNEVGYYFKL